MTRRPPRSTLFPYTALFLSGRVRRDLPPDYMTADEEDDLRVAQGDIPVDEEGTVLREMVPVRYRQEFTTTTPAQDRKSTRLNSSHANLVCRLLLEKKKTHQI